MSDTTSTQTGYTRALALIDQAAEEGWTELDLSGLGLGKLPEALGRLVMLERLILGKWDQEVLGNELTTLPGWIEKLENLRILEADYNKFDTFPEAITQLINLQKLSLAGNQLTEIPKSISKLQKLQELILWKNHIQEIPEESILPRNLLKLNLGSNEITDIPNPLGLPKNLRELGLHSNIITTIPGSISQLKNLESLILHSNKIKFVPDSFSQAENLKWFNLGRNLLGNFPRQLTHLSGLTHLFVFDNQITFIPEAIAQLSNLTHLDLSRNKITVIPKAIAKLSSLTHLGLSGNQIMVIPEAVTQLKSLHTLELTANKIQDLPREITQLQSLRELCLGENKIQKIPDEIGLLQNLESLYLGSNQVEEIPISITQIHSLKELDLTDNQISKIPKTIDNLQNLKHLYLSSNQIKEIPESVTQLLNLERLLMWKNQIKAIPESIAQLKNLRELYLGENEIADVPESIGQLQHLQELSLHKNQLTKIAQSTADLLNLKELYLDGNNITATPEELVRLEALINLDSLDLGGNCLPVSPEILDLAVRKFNRESGVRKRIPGNPSAIFNYLHQLRSGEVRPLNEAKLLLVGQGSVGKTSLINRLLNDHYNPTEPQTDGLAVHTWPIHTHSKDIRLNVWDFGGQEIYHATHQFFLTKRSLYLLVCNCRTSEDENRLEYWLKLIQSFGDASPVIIVGNKKDEQPLDLNRKALRDKYPNIKAILETSCQTGDGIPELRTTIRDEIAQLREVYDLLPLKWFDVKEQLEAMDDDFISYGKYIALCERNDIPEEQNQDQLITLLHNLGLVLNYRDHPILQTTNVLNPDWVTSGIYAILSDETLKTETKGILAPTDLSRILDPQRYPPSRHKYLIELMKEFQLGFDLPNCPQSRFLLPGLLPKEEPDNTQLPGEQKGDTLEFQYHYSVLPASVMSRFIVLTHDRLHKQTLWRSGILLTYREGDETYNIARIKADPEDRKIYISISGRESTRRIFLSLLRDTFSTIHRSFANPDDITEWVPVPGHPTADPLEYKELLGLEEMGETTVTIGKLKLRLDLRQLLDGYESRESRQKRQYQDKTGIHMPVHVEVNPVFQMGEGDNFGGDRK